jgi:copper chaperone CopZ
MLLEASDERDPTSFEKTDLFRKCREMGIIPRSEAELEEQAQSEESATSYASIHRHMGSLETQRERLGENALGLNLVVTDMWCPACAWVIEEALKRSSGVRNVFCNFSTDRVLCEYDPISTSPAQIIQTIDALGYKASIPGNRKKEGIYTLRRICSSYHECDDALLCPLLRIFHGPFSRDYPEAFFPYFCHGERCPFLWRPKNLPKGLGWNNLCRF